jgi:hypothetical protein
VLGIPPSRLLKNSNLSMKGFAMSRRFGIV